jgi:hypothetical protein
MTYSIPTGMTTRDVFPIKVRSPNSKWLPLDAYLAILNIINTTTGVSMIQNSPMAYFDFCDTVEVSVTYTKGKVHSSRIHPDSYGIVPKVRDNTLTFTLTKPRNSVIQINDDIFDCLHLLSNTINFDMSSADDPDVIYFGPGLHNSLTGNLLSVPSGKTVYLAGGAVLTARVSFVNGTNSVLRGRGVFYNNPSRAVLVEHSSGITIEGVTILDPAGYAVVVGEAKQLVIRNIHSFSSKGNGDGIDLFCCQYALVDGHSDDNIAIYSHGLNYYDNISNVTIQNSSLWADVAHPIVMGTHGNTMDGVTIRNVVLDHHEPQMLYQGCIVINPGDSNFISDVYIEDVREDFRLG